MNSASYRNRVSFYARYPKIKSSAAEWFNQSLDQMWGARPQGRSLNFDIGGHSTHLIECSCAYGGSHVKVKGQVCGAWQPSDELDSDRPDNRQSLTEDRTSKCAFYGDIDQMTSDSEFLYDITSQPSNYHSPLPSHAKLIMIYTLHMQWLRSPEDVQDLYGSNTA
jgi:hypothetical protein